MKINKTILVGFIFILLAGIIFLTDILNPIIRPITYLFLMGSSKGKDIMFFGLLGFFLITSQLIKRDIDTNKYLKFSVIVGSVLLILGIFIEILFRMEIGIGLNTIFASMTNGMSSTSILHTHLLKAILGEALTNLIGPIIQSNINTGIGLYSYVPDIAKLVILLIPIFTISIILSNQKRIWLSTALISFFSSCLIIGSIDGGLFGTPAVVGICGLYFIYVNEHYLYTAIGVSMNDEKSSKENGKKQHIILEIGKYKFTLKEIMPYLLVFLILVLRFTIAFAGAETDHYTVDVVNPTDTIEIPNIPIEKINQTDNKITYKVDSGYNEMELLNELKIPLNNSCEYYTVSWNIYSYF